VREPRGGFDPSQGLPERIRAGDHSAEEEFARRFGERVRTLMLVRTRRREVAEDLAQEALLAALESLRAGQLRDADRLPAFVLGTARNVLNNWFRASGRQPVEVSLPEGLPARASSETVEDSERHALVRAAIDCLSEKDRQIIRMTLVEGLEPGRIAAALGLRSDVVRARKSRAVRRIFEFLNRLSHPPRARPLMGGGKSWTADA